MAETSGDGFEPWLVRDFGARAAVQFVSLTLGIGAICSLKYIQPKTGLLCCSDLNWLNYNGDVELKLTPTTKSDRTLKWLHSEIISSSIRSEENYKVKVI